MKITFVKKILDNGEPCQKCADVEERLKSSGQMDRIDEVVIADERDPESSGMRLARQFEVNRAPFFLVEEEGQDTRVYTVYFKFAKDVFGNGSSKSDEAREILNDNPDLDFI